MTIKQELDFADYLSKRNEGRVGKGYASNNFHILRWLYEEIGTHPPGDHLTIIKRTNTGTFIGRLDFYEIIVNRKEW